MSYPTQLFFCVIVLVMPNSVYSQTDPQQLQIDHESVPLSIVEAYGKSMMGHREYCPPVSDKYVVDKFVRHFLFARESEADETALRDQALADKLEPLTAGIEKINRFLEEHPAKSRAGRVYRKQISRIESDIADLKLQSGEDYERRTRFRRNSYERLEEQKDVSDVHKKYLTRLLGFSDLYTKTIRDEITDEAIQRRYETLVAAKDERLVNVYVFKHRSLILKSHDKSNVEKVTGYLRRNATGKEISSGIYRIPGAMGVDSARWSRLHRLDAVSKDPSLVEIGSTFLEKVPDRIFEDVGDVYRLYYIYDKKFYPVIGLDQETVHYSLSYTQLEYEEYNDRLKAEGERLRARSVVSDRGTVVLEADDYPKCPRG